MKNPKGQEISDGNCDILNLSKKQGKKSLISALQNLKMVETEKQRYLIVLRGYPTYKEPLFFLIQELFMCHGKNRKLFHFVFSF